ncbi:MAG: hydrogenase nickel incorporation protein HypB [Proteobacteria bacterium]|nr:hydrogenase nickel incorporation protein HypB [Pseudomonadota bacterium]
MEIKVLKNVMIKNDAVGNDNRKRFKGHKIYTINITSSPGAGKTTLLENSLKYINKKYRTAIIEGDLYTSRDAERLAGKNAALVQINTEGGCHLDARMISGAANELDLNDLDIIFIENVGNLVCPAGFDLGENLRVLVYSITEGDDKPKKYLPMFNKADVILINKIELADICKINLNKLETEIREINPKCKIFRISAVNPDSLIEWDTWLDEQIGEYKKS